MKLEVITRAELELERTDALDKSRAYCEFKDICTLSGNYTRCYLKTCLLCPRYQSYYAQRENDKHTNSS